MFTATKDPKQNAVKIAIGGSQNSFELIYFMYPATGTEGKALADRRYLFLPRQLHAGQITKAGGNLAWTTLKRILASAVDPTGQVIPSQIQFRTETDSQFQTAARNRAAKETSESAPLAAAGSGPARRRR